MDLGQLTLRLCQIESTTGNEAAIADELQRFCKLICIGGRVERIGNTILAQGPVQPGRPTVALFGHSDTVSPQGEFPTPTIRDGKVIGLGASDMKGGLALMLALLAEADAAERGGGPRFSKNLRCIFYDKEEGPANESGILPLCEGNLLSDIDLALCLEPTDNLLQPGCVGGFHARVTFLGRAAHSARPWQGDNAVYKAAPFLLALAKKERIATEVAGLLFYEVTSVTQALASNSRNVVPESFVLNVNHRFPPNRTQQEAEAAFLATLEEHLPSDSKLEVKIEIVDRAPPGKVIVDHPLIREWQARVPLGIEAKQAWTDVARLSALGIPALNFGPGETAQAHQRGESIPLSNLEFGYNALRSLLV